MNCRFVVVMTSVAFFFASQALQAHSLMPAGEADTIMVRDSAASADPAEISQGTVVSRVHRYNSILSKIVTTEERNDTIYDSKTRWSLSLSIPSILSGNNGQTVACKKKNVGSPMKMKAYYPILFFGFAGLDSDDFRLKTGNSWEWGMYPIQGSVACSKGSTKRVCGFSAALGFSRTSYRLKGDDVFHVTEDGMTVCSPKEDLDYRKQRLVYWSWRVPVSFQYSFRADKQTYFFSVGAEAELRHHVKSRAHVGHSRKYVIESGSLAVNPWACNLMVQFGTDDCGVFARYALTDFFDKNFTALQGTPFMVGFAIGL